MKPRYRVKFKYEIWEQDQPQHFRKISESPYKYPSYDEAWMAGIKSNKSVQMSHLMIRVVKFGTGHMVE